MTSRHRVRVTRWVQNTRAGAGVGEFVYPQVGMGVGVGKILSGGCGWTIPIGDAHAIRRRGRAKTHWAQAGLAGQTALGHKCSRLPQTYLFLHLQLEHESRHLDLDQSGRMDKTACPRGKIPTLTSSLVSK